MRREAVRAHARSSMKDRVLVEDARAGEALAVVRGAA
jgi:hypothetical protein